MNASVEFRTADFVVAMDRLKSGVRAGFVDPTMGTIPVQGRLLAKRCQDFTPPRNKAQGEVAVVRDMSVIFRPLDPVTFRSRRIAEIVRKDNRPAWNAASGRFGDAHALRNTKAIGFDPGWHRRNRISRGRGRRGKKGNLGVVTLGPQGVLARKYMAEVKTRVGWARAGWNAGIVGLGGSVRTSWVARHGLGGGSLVKDTSSDNPFVRVTNATSWARYGSMGEGNRILQNAIRARARDMENYYRRMMKLAADRAQGVAA